MRPGAAFDVVPPLELERMPGGELVAIRSAEGDDAALLQDLVHDYVQTRGSDRHLGWLGISHRLPRSLQLLTEPAALEECLLAFEPRSGRPLGMASIGPRGSEHAIATPWMLVRAGSRHRGIGTALLERLASRARDREYDRFRLRVVVSEQRMLEMMRHVGIGCRPVSSLREVDADVPIPRSDGLGVALGAALWAIARGGLVALVPGR
jgi:GNAT superfamily N-acetyltransferase